MHRVYFLVGFGIFKMKKYAILAYFLHHSFPMASCVQQLIIVTFVFGQVSAMGNLRYKLQSFLQNTTVFFFFIN